MNEEKRQKNKKKNRRRHSVDERFLNGQKNHEAVAKERLKDLRTDFRENQETVGAEKSSLRSSRSFERPQRNLNRKTLRKKSKDDEWINSLRNELHDKKTVADFDFSFQDEYLQQKNSKSIKVNVKEMMKVKEERRNLEKRISSDWLNSLRSDINENPHCWVVLPSINDKTKSKEI